MRVRQRSDGRYEVRFSLEGKRFSLYGKTPDEALSKAMALKQRLEAHYPPPPSGTLQHLIDKWWVAREASWKPRTRAEYRRLLNKFIVPGLGRVRLVHLTPPRVQRFLHSVPGQEQRRSVYRLLHHICADACRWRWLPENPITRVEIPPRRRRPLDFPNLQQLQALLARCRAAGNQAGCALGLLLLCGLRIGELLALRWSDVDFVAQTLTVRRAGQWIDGVWVESTPKTPHGQRVIPLGPVAIELLRRQQELVASKRRQVGGVWADDYVFPGAGGGPSWAGYLRQALHRWCQELGIPRLRLHDLRGANASVAAAAGVPATQIADHLGHAGVRTTLQFYVHTIQRPPVAVFVEHCLLSEPFPPAGS